MLESRYINVNNLNDPILLGIVPFKLLVPRFRNVNDDNDPMLLGIVPDRVFIPRLKRCNEVNDPILLGIVPVNDKPANTIDVTLAYVADPLSVPHITP